MIKLHDGGIFLPKDAPPVNNLGAPPETRPEGLGPFGIPDVKARTCAYKILQEHNTSGSMDKMKLKFDSLTSHDITYVGIIQTARASGLREFPLPYVLTNCHNSLCAVGGTINEDDHVFGFSAAKKYGGIYVPAHMAVLHQYMREMMAGCGKMILGSDSHTRYGALGTLAIGEGGPELVKQLLGRTYDIDMPEVAAVYLTGKPADGVGPQDVALALIGAVFKTGFVKNKILEFTGPGIANLSAEYRMGIDVMTTETACLSSIWSTDKTIADYLEVHGRGGDFKEITPDDMAYYDSLITIDLSKVKPMIALPFHPSNTYEIETLNENLDDILAEVEKAGQAQLENPQVKLSLRDKIEDGKLTAQQGIIAGCAGGGFENIAAAADIIVSGGPGTQDNRGNQKFSLSVYPSSQPVNLALTRGGQMASLMSAGAVIRTAFCGPCFGAGDTPADNSLSIRHTTRNFQSREGSRPQSGQLASVALMDARSIAATALNGGRLTPATDVDVTYTKPEYRFDGGVYKNRCYFGFGKPLPDEPLRLAPSITDWPEMRPLPDDLMLKVVSVIKDPVTTTDELIPSGETASYRSNPLELASFTLQRKDPSYVPKARAVQALEQARLNGENPMAADRELSSAWQTLCEQYPQFSGHSVKATGIGSAVYAVKPGDGSAREQAASCQRVLGTLANFAGEYATKRYRSNLINWGMLPFICEDTDGLPKSGSPLEPDDFVFLPGIKNDVKDKTDKIAAYVISGKFARRITLTLGSLTDTEREIIICGCLINYYAGK